MICKKAKPFKKTEIAIKNFLFNKYQLKDGYIFINDN